MNERKPDTNIDVQISLGQMNDAQGLLSAEQKASLLNMKKVASVLRNQGLSLTVEEITEASRVTPIKIGSRRGSEILLSM